MHRPTPTAALLWCLCLAPSLSRAASPADDVLAQMPAATLAAEGQLSAELVKLGPAGLKAVCGKLVPLGTGDDTKARYALAGLSRHVGRPGAEAERAAYAGVLLEALGSASDNEVKAFLVHELQVAGKDEAVAPLAKLLADPALGDPAARALAQVRTPAAVGALADALPASTGANRVALMKALGELRAEPAAAEILKSAASEDAATRLTALAALADIAPPAAGDLLAKASQAAAPLERSRATALYLLYARRLGEGGKKEQAAQICRDLIQSRQSAEEANVRCAALGSLVTVLGPDALADLLAASVAPDAEYRNAALNFAARLPGEGATSAWAAKLKDAPPEARADVLAMLGRRGDKSASAAALAALEDADAAVRAAAVPAAAALAGDGAVPGLVKLVLSAPPVGKLPDDARAAADALARLPGDRPLAAAAEALPKTSGPPRTALLDVLAGRAARAHAGAAFALAVGADPAARLAALAALEKMAGGADQPRLIELALGAKDPAEETARLKPPVASAGALDDPEQRPAPLLAAVARSAGPKRAALLRVLPRLPGKASLAAVVADTRNPDAPVKDAAIRALAEWPDFSAADELLKVARDEKDLTPHVLALRGCVQVTKSAAVPAARKVQTYREAMSAARRPDEKKLVVAAAAAERGPDALALLSDAIDDPALKADASAAAIRMALPSKEGGAGLRGEATTAALKKAVAATSDPKLREQGEKYLATIANTPK